MAQDISQHPCFSDTARHKYGRVHLPVAPRCNVQCNYCSRDFDCVNESRPGVTSGILLPEQALVYLDEIVKKTKNIKVVGIAGPGDPFANPEETIKTLKLVREKYPDMLLCVATNGMNLLPYVEELKEIGISHVTITMNSIDPEIISKIYSWYRPGKKVETGIEGAKNLLQRQLAGIKALKLAGITVKINTVIVSGINENSAIDVASKARECGADILNCIPMYKTAGTKFAGLESPSPETMEKIRQSASVYMPQMRHCARCRADAAGMIGQNLGEIQVNAINTALGSNESGLKLQLNALRPLVGVISREGMFVNMHLGEAQEVYMYTKADDGGIRLLEKRKVPQSGGGILRWKELGNILKDTGTLLVSDAGNSPKYALMAQGIDVISVEGLVEEAVSAVLYKKDISKMQVKTQSRCGQTCSGKGGGC